MDRFTLMQPMTVLMMPELEVLVQKVPVLTDSEANKGTQVCLLLFTKRELRYCRGRENIACLTY